LKLIDKARNGTHTAMDEAKTEALTRAVALMRMERRAALARPPPATSIPFPTRDDAYAPWLSAVAEGAVNYANSWGFVALIEATNRGHIEIVRALLAAGADVNHANNYRNTPLIYAAARGHTEIVRVLRDAGADLNFTNSQGLGLTAREIAIEKGHIGVVQVLETASNSEGARESKSGETEETEPRGAKSQRGATEEQANVPVPPLDELRSILKVMDLLDPSAIADVNAEGLGLTKEIDSTLGKQHYVPQGYPRACPPITQPGSDEHGAFCTRPPLGLARVDDEREQEDGLYQLSPFGVEPASLLMLAIAADQGYLVLDLLDYRPDVNYQTPTLGLTALHLAAQDRASTEPLELLLGAGANRNLLTTAGESAMDLALRMHEADGDGAFEEHLALLAEEGA
jgi:ankyrin repeat protein